MNFQKKYLSSPTKELNVKQNNYSSIGIKDFDDDSDFDFNDKTKKIINESEHLQDIKSSINVSNYVVYVLILRKYQIKFISY